MASNRTNARGVESVARDYRGGALPNDLAQHVLGERIGDVRHACPECGITVSPNPLCAVCLGVGTVSTERLDRYAFQVFTDSTV